jgi:hypothetical protein
MINHLLSTDSANRATEALIEANTKACHGEDCDVRIEKDLGCEHEEVVSRESRHPPRRKNYRQHEKVPREEKQRQ